jgi:hypothetical protein
MVDRANYPNLSIHLHVFDPLCSFTELRAKHVLGNHTNELVKWPTLYYIFLVDIDGQVVLEKVPCFS